MCQTPAYVAHAKGFFAEENLDVTLNLVPTAWQIPMQFSMGTCDFAVMPWTRVAKSESSDTPLVAICGSGVDEAAIVTRKGMALEDVQSLAVPREGGIKDLTAMGMIDKLGWNDLKLVRQPSGDGAILSLVGQGADAASMIEPFATMMELRGIGQVVKRTSDLWHGAPGCSLATSRAILANDPDTVESVIRAFVRGAMYANANHDEAAEISAPYIGIGTDSISCAYNHNKPDIHALRNTDQLNSVLALMQKCGYIEELPSQFIDLTLLDKVVAELH
jgi:ABC-type nitrate/sulfonate/bicarbonate transport system substrate-binding protein